MEDLKTCRERIDQIDRQLVRLFENRMDTVIQIATYKLSNGLPIRNAGREQEVLDKCVSLLNNKSYSEAVVSWMRATIDLSCLAQEKYLKEHK